MLKGTLFDIRRYSIHDGPGIRTTVFFKGCPLSCWWCDNPESLAPTVELIFRKNRCIRCEACLTVCEQGAIAWNGAGPVTDVMKCARCGSCALVCYADARECVGRDLTVDEVMAEVRRDAAFYDESGGGVTLSGGEPLQQPDFALTLLQACRGDGIHTALDTSGFAPWEVMDRIRPYADLFLYDLKLVDEIKHRKFTGMSNDLILKNLRALSQCGHNIVVRVPVVPGINDDEENMRQIRDFLAALPHLDGINLLPYHNLGVDKYVRLNHIYRLPDTHSPSTARIGDIARLLTSAGLTVRIGG
ncbi:MAG: glycyl-radical enzyme activating protein [Candidatus Eisenbacteria bacterium]|nr:glycyl-radical enzyme activating protein [Candidatus Eisenbacteria bacterium]